MSEFGSIAWQDMMIKKINTKMAKGQKLEPGEECFLEVQANHNIRILEGCA